MRSPVLLVLLAVCLAACGDAGPPGRASAGSPSATATPASSTTTPRARPGDASPSAAPTTPGTVAPTPTRRPTARSSPTPTRPTELRAVWVHLFDDTLKSPASIDRMLDRVAASGANTVIAEVVRRQDAYYRSAVLPRTADPAVPAGFDPLARLVEGAHGRGLRLHAWVPLTPTYHHVYDDLPRPDGWVFSEHGPRAPAGRRWVTRLADGTWDTHLDPGHPAVRDHLVAVTTEIARRYDVDALHLDYLRYTGRDAGYNPSALARFGAATGQSGAPAPDDPAFGAWRRRQVRTLLARIRRSVRRAAPEVGISAAVTAQREGPHDGRPFAATRPHAAYFQDWPSWLRDGLVDAAMPMIYFEQTRHPDWFAQWTAFARRVAAAVEPAVAPGVGGWLNPPAAGAGQLRAVMEGTDGGAVYSYQQNADGEAGDRLLDRLGAGRWADPAQPPDLP